MKKKECKENKEKIMVLVNTLIDVDNYVYGSKCDTKKDIRKNVAQLIANGLEKFNAI